MRISIRAPARGATTVSVCAEFSGSNFNPRSREGSDIDWVSNPLCNAISIRTPARGATRTWTRLPRLCRFQSALPRGERLACVGNLTKSCKISIRAPARGATYTPTQHLSSKLFQSALPRGERHDRRAGDDRSKAISIRAPARGATMRYWQQSKTIIFQSALPRGERPRRWRQQSSRQNFNPRSREGSDGTGDDFHNYGNISIRAPARGATKHTFFLHRRVLFQSALPRGERPILSKKSSSVSTFQSALPRGERPTCTCKGSSLMYFNPRSREGSDPQKGSR